MVNSVKKPVDLSKPKVNFRQFFINRKRINTRNSDNSPAKHNKENREVTNKTAFELF